MEVAPLEFSTNGELALYSSHDGVLKLWETATNSLKNDYKPSSHLSATCTCLSWAPKSGTDHGRKKKKRKSGSGASLDAAAAQAINELHLVAIGTASGNILLYSVVKGDLHNQLSDGHSDTVNGVCWDVESNSLYSCSSDHHIVHWEVTSAKIKHKWKADKGPVHSLCRCSSTHLLSAGRSIKLWDLTTRQVIKTFTGHATEVFKMYHVPTSSDSTSIENTYFLSAAVNDRLVNAWQLDTSSKDKSAVASFSLPDEPVSLQVSRLDSKDRAVVLVVITQSGQALLFECTLNGKLKKPLQPKLTIQIATPGSKTETPKPVPILAAYICDENDKNLILMHGNYLKPTFEKVVKTPEVSKDVTVLAPGFMAPVAMSQDPAKRRKRKPSIGDMTIEERLSAIGVDQPNTSCSSATQPPKADTLARLLTQGLQSQDGKILNNVLQNRNTTLVRNTVKKLPVQMIIPLIQELTKRLHGHAQREENTGKDRLFNDLLKCCEKENVKFSGHQKELGSRILKDLCDVLWYLDPFHERFRDRHIKIPKPFDSFKGYRDWRKQHKKEPRVAAEELKVQINTLSSLLMLPWFLNDRFKLFREAVNGLLEALRKYETFLSTQKERTAICHKAEDPVRSLSDNWNFIIVEKSPGTADFSQYKDLCSVLQSLDCYQCVDLTDFEPDDCETRRVWLKKLVLPFPYGIFTFSHGNYLGNLTVVWKQPVEKDDRDGTEDIRLISEIKANIPKYATRTMRRDFFEKYSKASKDKPAVLRSVYRYLTGHSFAPENKDQATVDNRVCEFLLDSDDPKLILDLRKNNGRLKNPDYDPFWKELGMYLDEKSVVHERRRTDIAYMPFALSVRDLKEQVLARMPPNSPAPSDSWIRLNFCPANPYAESAARYTGQFSVKHAVQQRILRAKHADSEFAYYQFTLLKHFAVKWREHTLMQCLDDKAIIPIGEPGKPTTVFSRVHNPGLVCGDNRPLLSLDHDFHICGLVPSVCLLVDIPDDVKGSFHRGNVHITVKDKIFEPSSPLRHATETVKIVRESVSENDVDCDSPIIIRYTDGGPDHRTTYKSVQLAAIREFIALDLDMLIACRTAPSQSYNNPAERVMSLLNLGLQNVSLAREEMDAGFELIMKSMSSIKKVRGSQNQSFKDALQASVNAPMEIVKEIFSRLKRTHGTVTVHDASSEERIGQIAESTEILQERSIDQQDGPLTMESEELKSFVARHCKASHYVFQVKKCDHENAHRCSYCHINRPRLPAEVYKDLHFLPDPVLDKDGNYESFDSVYGKDTNDKDRPSLKVKPVATDRDKRFRCLLVAGKVRSFVMCVECGKRRIVYSPAGLKSTELQAIMRVQEELLYICGNTLFPGGTYQDTLVVREGLNCSSPIETTYYAGVTQVFDAICFYCGDLELLLNEEIKELRDNYSIVRPICSTCFQAGLKPATRNAKKTKRQKRN